MKSRKLWKSSFFALSKFCFRIRQLHSFSLYLHSKRKISQQFCFVDYLVCLVTVRSSFRVYMISFYLGKTSSVWVSWLIRNEHKKGRMEMYSECNWCHYIPWKNRWRVFLLFNFPLVLSDNNHPWKKGTFLWPVQDRHWIQKNDLKDHIV